MIISQKKQEHKNFAPLDPVYAKMIYQLRLKIKHFQEQKPDEIRALKISCMRRFEQFNGVKQISRFYSLYTLCDDQHLRDQAVQRD